MFIVAETEILSIIAIYLFSLAIASLFYHSFIRLMDCIIAVLIFDDFLILVPGNTILFYYELIWWFKSSEVLIQTFIWLNRFQMSDLSLFFNQVDHDKTKNEHLVSKKFECLLKYYCLPFSWYHAIKRLISITGAGRTDIQGQAIQTKKRK